MHSVFYVEDAANEDCYLRLILFCTFKQLSDYKSFISKSFVINTLKVRTESPISITKNKSSVSQSVLNFVFSRPFLACPLVQVKLRVLEIGHVEINLSNPVFCLRNIS